MTESTTDMSTKLSAYLDGELDAFEARKLEEQLGQDPALQAELDGLIAADAAFVEYHKDSLDQPVPFDLVKSIKDTPLPDRRHQAPPRRRFVAYAGAMAACVALVGLGGIGGYSMGQGDAPVQSMGQPTGWLSQIVSYHAIYAQQKRHLVEVTADQADHIETWLGKTIGASFAIPNLSDFDLTFEGGRLLVVNGKPVAQLMYRTAEGTVVALCLQKGGHDAQGKTEFGSRTQDGFALINWKDGDADYVMIAPQGFAPLPEIAETAATMI